MQERERAIVTGLVLLLLVLVLALTAMAFTALEPQRTDRADWAVSLPEPQAAVVPTFR